jgi:hypothetical protein
VTSWSVLTSHARALLCIARDPGARLRDIAAGLGSTERSAHGNVTGLSAAGYVIKHKDGRRNRHQIQARLPLPEPATQEPAIGEVLVLLAGAAPGCSGPGPDQAEATAAEPACTHPRQTPGAGAARARLIRPEVREGPDPDTGVPAAPFQSRMPASQQLRPLPHVWRTHDVAQLASIHRPWTRRMPSSAPHRWSPSHPDLAYISAVRVCAEVAVRHRHAVIGIAGRRQLRPVAATARRSFSSRHACYRATPAT